MSTRHFILATAGHVDHGKSSLIKALTGTDPDRLPEEKARGITIDLGFAHLALPANIDGQPGEYHLGIVDVPGHEDFVKNMVAGVGSIDLALLVVAADDGWMPQTEEHLQILSYLGVSRGVVALTKIDLAEDEAAIQDQIREKLRNSPLHDAPIIPTSVVSGRGIGEIKAALQSILANTPLPRDIGKPRLPVDRVFMLRGIGMVVTGTLKDGSFHRGQDIIVQPSGRAGRIRSLQNHNREVEHIGPGTRTALNLPDVKAPTGESPIRRGDVITVAELGSAGTLLDVLLEKSARLIGQKSGAARPIKDGARVRVHLGSADASAHLFLLERGILEAGGLALAQLRFEEPVYALAGDRFIVRDWSQQTTLAGGLVLDANPAAGNFRSDSRRDFLQARRTASLEKFIESEISHLHAAPASSLLVKSRFSADEISEAVRSFAAAGKITLAGRWAIETGWWQRLRQDAAEKIDAFHRAHPDRPGLPLTELRTWFASEHSSPELFEILAGQLCQADFAQSGNAIRRKTHQLALPPQLQAAGTKLRQALAAKPSDPPSRKELAPDAPAQQALRFLIQTGEVVELSPEIVLRADEFRRASAIVADHIAAKGPATASDLRLALGTSRRILIPLLERLDREGLTRREGDKRVLSEPSACR